MLNIDYISWCKKQQNQPHGQIITSIYEDMISKNPKLTSCIDALINAHEQLVQAFTKQNLLLICGNGGSNSDALHISGELLKSFEHQRCLSNQDKKKLSLLKNGSELANILEYAFRVIALGQNSALVSAVLNDTDTAGSLFAQECFALGRNQDILMCLTTSGKAKNLIWAVETAKLRSMKTIAFTGKNGGELAKIVDIEIRAPGNKTAEIQENHIILYHALCAAVEAHFFPTKR